VTLRIPACTRWIHSTTRFTPCPFCHATIAPTFAPCQGSAPVLSISTHIGAHDWLHIRKYTVRGPHNILEPVWTSQGSTRGWWGSNQSWPPTSHEAQYVKTIENHCYWVSALHYSTGSWDLEGVWTVASVHVLHQPTMVHPSISIISVWKLWS